MSTIDLDAMDVFVAATEEARMDVSALNVYQVFKYLDSSGWHIARKPVSFTEPAIAPATPSKQWPPRGITRLWATDMKEDRTAWSEVSTSVDLKFVTDRGGRLISALNEDDARRCWNDRSSLEEGSFTIDGRNYLYIYDPIPF